MSSPAHLFICLSTAVFLHVAVAAAQVGSSAPRPEPVSPGGAGRATLAAACPTFSWAQTQWAVAYELVVYEVERPSGLKGAPALRASLPAGASSWSPSVADCLRPGGDYIWYIREVGRKGEAVGTWSDGMAFSVVNPAQPAQTASVASTKNSSASTKDSSPQAQNVAVGDSAPVSIAPAAAGDHGRGTPPPSNEDIFNRINDVLAKLNEPEPPFSFNLCTEPAFQGELEAGSQLKLDGTIEGRVGAEGYGNGAMIRLKGAPAQKLEGNLKGAWDILKLGMCWDIGATVRNRKAAAALAAGGSTSLASAAAPRSLAAAGTQDLADTIAGLDLPLLQTKLQGLADRLQFNPAGSIAALESLGDLSLENGPFAALREDGLFQQLAANLPLPPNVKTLLLNPASVLDIFQEIRTQGLCNMDLPPAMSGPIAQICGLIAGERFSKLLDRVDDVTTTVNSKVTNVTNKIQDILDALPTSDSCKLFCDR